MTNLVIFKNWPSKARLSLGKFMQTNHHHKKRVQQKQEATSECEREQRINYHALQTSNTLWRQSVSSFWHISIYESAPFSELPMHDRHKYRRRVAFIASLIILQLTKVSQANNRNLQLTLSSQIIQTEEPLANISNLLSYVHRFVHDSGKGWRKSAKKILIIICGK